MFRNKPVETESPSSLVYATTKEVRDDVARATRKLAETVESEHRRTRQDVEAVLRDARNPDVTRTLAEHHRALLEAVCEQVAALRDTEETTPGEAPREETDAADRLVRALHTAVEEQLAGFRTEMAAFRADLARPDQSPATGEAAEEMPESRPESAAPDAADDAAPRGTAEASGPPPVQDPAEPGPVAAGNGGADGGPATHGPALDDGEPQPAPEHTALLRQAARLAQVTLVCHRDAWSFLAGLAATQPHFGVPDHLTELDRQRVAVALSGRSLTAALITLHTTARTAPADSVDHALAAALYQRCQDELHAVTELGNAVVIVLDDRSPAPAATAPEPAGACPDDPSET